MKPDIYLHIDGVLLVDEDSFSMGAKEFIIYATENFEVYWLTTHCMNGDPAHAVRYLQRSCDEDISTHLKKFKPTTWSLMKTEAIDFSKPFLWLDDDCFSGEKQALRQRDVFNSWIEVDLKKYPDQMIHELELLKSTINEKT